LVDVLQEIKLTLCSQEKTKRNSSTPFI